MPKLDEAYEKAAESGTGGFKAMEPGRYMCRITEVQTEWTKADGTVQRAEERKCVRLLLDVAEGEHEGEFSREFYDGKEWARCVYLSWSDNALGMLKHSFKALDEANPGFDSRAAFEADQWGMFKLRKVLVGFNGSERTNTRGYVNVNARPDRMLCQDDRWEPKVELERGGTVDWADYADVRDQPQRVANASAYDDSGVPF